MFVGPMARFFLMIPHFIVKPGPHKSNPIEKFKEEICADVDLLAAHLVKKLNGKNINKRSRKMIREALVSWYFLDEDTESSSIRKVKRGLPPNYKRKKEPCGGYNLKIGSYMYNIDTGRWCQRQKTGVVAKKLFAKYVPTWKGSIKTRQMSMK